MLIRGVTPTGKNKVPMAQLRELLELSPDFSSVQTYIQSGNVILETDLSLRETEQLIHKIVLDNFGGDLVIIAKNHEQLQRSFKNYPIKNIPTERQYYTFLKEVPTKDGIKKLAERDFGNDKYQIIDDMVYVAFATKASDSRLTNNIIVCLHHGDSTSPSIFTTPIFLRLKHRSCSVTRAQLWYQNDVGHSGKQINDRVVV